MNTHEIDRISAAMNMLRPDWPKQQLRTLLADERITDRPRRDVCVALAWVACEPNSHTPYRVLEAGPWWKAAGIEGASTAREKVDRSERCSVCSESHDRCRVKWAGDHEFLSAAEAAKAKAEADPASVTRVVEALKAELDAAPTRETAPARTLDDLAERDPKLKARVDMVRAALPAPPLREPAPPTPLQPSGAAASETEPQEVPA